MAKSFYKTAMIKLDMLQLSQLQHCVYVCETANKLDLYISVTLTSFKT